MPNGKQYIRLVAALKEGAATSGELAAELGMNTHIVAAQLSKCHAMGIVTRTLAPAQAAGRSGRAPYLYRAAG